jgi:hypothetical protein
MAGRGHDTLGQLFPADVLRGYRPALFDDSDPKYIPEGPPPQNHNVD